MNKKMSRRKVTVLFKYIFLILVSIISVFPLYWMIVSGTNRSVDVIAGRMIPGTYLLENLRSLLDTTILSTAMLNSIRNALVSTILNVLVCSVAGYGFEKYRDKKKDHLMSVLLLSMMVPTAATVAGPEPDTAAKNMQTKTVTMAKPPVMRPKNTLQTSRIRRDTPPAPIKSPAKMNKGIARIGNESQLVINACGMEVKLKVSPTTKANILDTPKAIPTGTLRINRTIRAINRVRPTIIYSPYKFSRSGSAGSSYGSPKCLIR